MKADSFLLTKEELARLNEIIQKGSQEYYAQESEPMNDVTVSFHFGPAGIRIVKVSIAGGVSVALDD